MTGATIEFLTTSKIIKREFKDRKAALDWIYAVAEKSENLVGGLDDGSHALWVGEKAKDNNGNQSKT